LTDNRQQLVQRRFRAPLARAGGAVSATPGASPAMDAQLPTRAVERRSIDILKDGDTWQRVAIPHSQ
jgi:hypothetical protein